MLDGKRILGVGFDKIEGAWILDCGPDVDLWFTLDKFYWIPEFTASKSPFVPGSKVRQEDVDIRWLWFWVGYTRRYKSSL